MALASPGFWPWAEGALSQLDVDSWALGQDGGPRLHPHQEAGSSRCWGPQRAQGRGPAALREPSAEAHELQVQFSFAVLRTVSQAETSGHTPPPGVHKCSLVGDSSTRPPTHVILVLL